VIWNDLRDEVLISYERARKPTSTDNRP